MSGVQREMENLLALDGEIMGVHETSGHWVKIEARRVKPTAERPYGVRYSLTLHDHTNRRVLGYDNAHGTPKRRVPFDHKHRHQNDEGVPYKFQSAERLLEDFWNDVDRVLRQFDHS